MKDLDLAISLLKINKSRDPFGLIGEIFKPKVCGLNLKLSLLMLFNKIKRSQYIPWFFRFSNITTFWKKQGDKMKLKFHRGIFLITVFKYILMKLIYQRKYPIIDSNMSDSNVGGRKSRSIRDHLLIVNGIIQDTLSSKTNEPIDILICDYKTCFDGLSIPDTFNSLYENGLTDDSFSLLYELYKNHKVAIKTPVGLTDRIDLQEIICQGDPLGPLLCSSSVDCFGKDCVKEDKHLYFYRQKTPIMPLTMLDDQVCISKCGVETNILHSFINSKTNFKKLQFGPEKCYNLHVGKTKKYS